MMKARHGFGKLSDVQNALNQGKIDAYDILFLDGDTEPKIGWIDSKGEFRLVRNEADFSELEEMIAKKADASDVEALETELASKVSAEEVDAKVETAVTEKVETAVKAEVEATVETAVEAAVEAKVETAVEAAVKEEVKAEVESAVKAEVEAAVEKVDYEISHAPDGTLVDYRDKEIRVMIPADTQFELQNSGEGADANSYYIGFKAYAPVENVVSFKEDLAEIIADNTMYSFEGNEFAGIDEFGYKYSIVWLPVAKYDGSAWTYYGANSNKEKFIGWHYSVQWYDVNGKVVASDCIRINLSNESCHSVIEPYYVSAMKTEMKSEIETMVDEKIAETESGNEIIEF